MNYFNCKVFYNALIESIYSKNEENNNMNIINTDEKDNTNVDDYNNSYLELLNIILNKYLNNRNFFNSKTLPMKFILNNNKQ